jgi:hypothetical protein
MTLKEKIWLLVIILFAAYFRFAPNLVWDHGLLLHPDERFLTMVAEKVTIPNSIAEYWDSRLNTLSPYNNGHDYYVYGNLPLTITKLVAVATGLNKYDDIFLVGRALSGFVDILTIFGIFLLGRLLFNVQAGLAAAGLLTLSVQNIQLCRFMGTENFVGMMVVFCAVFLVLAGKSLSEDFPSRLVAWKARTYFILSAFILGLGLACKISAVFFLPICIIAIGWNLLFISPDYLSREQQRKFAPETWLGLTIIFITVMIIGFRIGQPSAFAGNSFMFSEQFIDNMRRIKEVTDGGEWPPNVQWAGRTPILFTLRQIFFFEMGPGLALLCLAGLIFSISEIIRRKNFRSAILSFWVLFFLLYQSTRFVAYGRYLSIIYPFACVLAGWWLMQNLSSKRKFIGYSLTAAALIWVFAFHSIYFKPHSRVEASRWIYENVPVGSVIGSEQWDDTLPLRVDGKDGFGGMYTEKSYNFYEVDTDKKRNDIADYLQANDYIAISSNRQFATIPRLIKRYPFTSIYYEKLFSGQLGFELVHAVVRKPSFMGIDFDTRNAVESFTVYDHPAVYIFKKTSAFSRDAVFKMLNDFPNGQFEPVTKATTKEIPWIY